MKTSVLITGILGQDGSYLAELLLAKGYDVHGIIRAGDNYGGKGAWRIQHILDAVTLHPMDMTNYQDVKKIITEIKPNEVYHLATKHESSNSLENYLATRTINLDSTYFFLSVIKEFCPSSKFFFAGSSRIFGGIKISPQNEETPMSPDSFYGISKATSLMMVRMFREKEGIFACSGILFNHESPRRDSYFLPKKVTMAAAQIKAGLADSLRVGDLNARRDWGFAGDYIEAMWLMLQNSKPEDFVIGTGETHTVQELIELAFTGLGLDWHKFVKIDPALVRPPEKIEIRADITKAKRILGWSPKTQFKQLVQMMVDADFESVRQQKHA